MFYKKFEVKPNQVGFLYKENKLEQRLEAGVYSFFDWKEAYILLTIPVHSKTTVVVNQEVLTKDNIALRFSYMVQYRIAEPALFVEQFDVLGAHFSAFGTAEFLVHNYSQVFVREAIIQLSSEELNEKRGVILGTDPKELNEQLSVYGIVVEKQLLKDISFPKNIQNLFAKRLEAQIRAKTDLENARTTVATARTLKNASALLKDDDNIKFIQLLEVMTKISEKGKHTFVMSDVLHSYKTK